MRYKVLLPQPKRGSRLTETIGIYDKQISFNRAICSRLGISSVGVYYIALAHNDDGFLCLMVLRNVAARTAFRLTSPPASKPGYRLIYPGKEILARLPKGRYAITGQDGAWYITDCRWIEDPDRANTK